MAAIMRVKKIRVHDYDDYDSSQERNGWQKSKERDEIYNSVNFKTTYV